MGKILQAAEQTCFSRVKDGTAPELSQSKWSLEKIKHVLVALLGIGIAVVGPAAFAQNTAPTTAECDVWFGRADTNADGKLNTGENTTFVDAINKSATTKLDTGADLDKTVFADACAKGTLRMPPA